MTLQDIENLKSPNGGYSKEALDSLGVQWPPEAGWKEKLVSKPGNPMSRMQRYNAYLQSEHWRALKRLKVSEVGDACQVCTTSNLALHGHHIRYRKLYDCVTDDILMLCHRCHDTFHLAQKHFHLESATMELPTVQALISEYLGTASGLLREWQGRKLFCKKPPMPAPKRFRFQVRKAMGRAKSRNYTSVAIRELIDRLESVLTEFGHQP